MTEAQDEAKGIRDDHHGRHTQQQLPELWRYAQDTAPVLDCLRSSVPVATTLEVI